MKSACITIIPISQKRKLKYKEDNNHDHYRIEMSPKLSISVSMVHTVNYGCVTPGS